MEDRRLKRTFELPTDGELVRLERRCFNTKIWPRVVMLRRLRENKTISIAALSEATGLAPSTVKAHLSRLRKEGVEGLLGTSLDGCRLPESAIEDLRSKLLEGTITGYREIREWVLEKHDVSYTDSGIRSLIQRELKLERKFVSRKQGESGQSDDIVDAVFAKRLLRMVNRLPVDKNLKAWGAGFRDALFELLPNAVYIVSNIHVNVPTDGSPAKSRARSVVYLESDEQGDSPAVRAIFTKNRAEESENVDEWVRNILDVLDNMKKYDPARHCHEVRSVKLNGTVEVARMLILYRRGSGDEYRDRKILDMIDPFLGFCISDAVARQAQRNQVDTIYSKVSRAARMAKLTGREKDVFFAYVLGASRNEIAAQLHISDSSVKNNITAIHKKLKARSLGDVLVYVNSPGQTGKDLNGMEQ